MFVFNACFSALNRDINCTGNQEQHYKNELNIIKGGNLLLRNEIESIYKMFIILGQNVIQLGQQNKILSLKVPEKEEAMFLYVSR